jgi:hypothetical protein
MPTHGYIEVASAAICVSCLLNAPPGFIEFLLCSPWSQMHVLNIGGDLKTQLGAINITSEQRQEVVNTRLPDHVLPIILGFIYQEQYEMSLPPMLLRTHDSSGAKLPPPKPYPPPEADPSGHISLPVRTWPPMTKEVRVRIFWFVACPCVCPGYG